MTAVKTALRIAAEHYVSEEVLKAMLSSLGPVRSFKEVAEAAFLSRGTDKENDIHENVVREALRKLNNSGVLDY